MYRRLVSTRQNLTNTLCQKNTLYISDKGIFFIHTINFSKITCTFSLTSRDEYDKFFKTARTEYLKKIYICVQNKHTYSVKTHLRKIRNK